MLPVLRNLRARLSLPLAALFALSVLGASAESQLSDLAHPESHVGSEADGHGAVAHDPGAHPKAMGDAEGHGSQYAHPPHGSEHERSGHGSEHDHPGHGCDGCTCVAAAGCSGPALFPLTLPATASPEASSSAIRWSTSIAINRLGHDIFRPPRS